MPSLMEIHREYPQRVYLPVPYRLSEQETRERLTALAFFDGVKIGHYEWHADDLAALADWAGIPHSGAVYYLTAWTLPVHVPARWWDFGAQAFNWVAQPDLATAYKVGAR